MLQVLLTILQLSNGQLPNTSLYDCNTKIMFKEDASRYPFSLPELPYPYDYLEPLISKETNYMHHEKYIGDAFRRLNDYLEDNQDLQDLTLTQLLQQAREDVNIERYAGAAYNHILYFWTLTNQACSNGPIGMVRERILERWNSIEDFYNEFTQRAMTLFGSGSIFLCVTADDEMRVVSYRKERNPLMMMGDTYCYPILSLDMWEHAYYLEFLYDKQSYVEELLELIDWRLVENFYNNYAWSRTPVVL